MDIICQISLFRELAFARSYGPLTAIWGASIGPFSDKKMEQQFAQELQKVDLITVRETKSLDYLAELGVKKTVHLVADPAFLLNHQKEGTDTYTRPGKELVGLGISGLVSELWYRSRRIF